MHTSDICLALVALLIATINADVAMETDEMANSRDERCMLLYISLAIKYC